MGRPQKPDPKYRHHKRSGQAVVTLTDAAGHRRDVYLGRYRSAASKKAYRRAIAEWEATQHHSTNGQGLSINELILAFMRWGKGYYGKDSRELDNYRDAFGPLKLMYGLTSVTEFGPLRLKSLRQGLIEKKLCRKTINRRIGRIKRLFKWGVEEELIPANVFHALQAVAGLVRGRSLAEETDGVKPVPDAFVDATLPHVSRTVRAMIEVQRLTGMRPGEVIQMRASDIDMTGDVWLYRPERHKNTWRGRDRVCPIGPKAQAIIREFLVSDITAYLFSPIRDREERFLRMRAARKSSVQPSQLCRRKSKPKRIPGNRYTVHSYRRAIKYGAALANSAAIKQAREAGEKVANDALIVPEWSPNQLRHSKATEVRRQFGLEAAQVVLGHARADVTQHYAERDNTLAIEVARKTG